VLKDHVEHQRLRAAEQPLPSHPAGYQGVDLAIGQTVASRLDDRSRVLGSLEQAGNHERFVVQDPAGFVFEVPDDAIHLGGVDLAHFRDAFLQAIEIVEGRASGKRPRSG
jgi:hypothetical protein